MHFHLQQWRIIAGGTKCIPKSELPVEDDDPQSQTAAPPSSRLWLHPSDLSIALSASTPLYLPGKIDLEQHLHTFQCHFRNYVHPCFGLDNPGVLTVHNSIEAPEYSLV